MGMINKQELRAGNWVRLKVDKESFKVDEDAKVIEILEEKVATTIADVPQINPYSNLRPIPLTPELLKACGFVLSEDHYILPSDESEPEEDYYANKLDFAIGVTGESYRLWNGCGDTEYAIGRTFQYVHELQNLFHSLTGEELSITL